MTSHVSLSLVVKGLTKFCLHKIRFAQQLVCTNVGSLCTKVDFNKNWLEQR